MNTTTNIEKAKTNIEKAKQLLEVGETTCALVRGDSQYTSTTKGISPMLDFLENGIDLNGYAVADKIVGKAAAMLFALAGISEVYAEVLSASGETILKNYRIKYSYCKLVDYIINRQGTGMCPMEQTVAGIDDLSAAKSALIQKRQILRNSTH